MHTSLDPTTALLFYVAPITINHCLVDLVVHLKLTIAPPTSTTPDTTIHISTVTPQLLLNLIPTTLSTSATHEHRASTTSNTTSSHHDEYTDRVYECLDKAAADGQAHYPLVSGTVTLAPSDFSTSLCTLQLECTASPVAKNRTRVSNRTPANILHKTARAASFSSSSPFMSSNSSSYFRSTLLSTTSSSSSLFPPTHPSQHDAHAYLNHFQPLLLAFYYRTARPDQLDAALLSHAETVLGAIPPLLSLPEVTLLETVLSKDDHSFSAVTGNQSIATSLDSSILSWDRIPNTVYSPVSMFAKRQKGTGALGKAHSVVDAGAKRVFAWLWSCQLYERRTVHLLENGFGNGVPLLRLEHDVPNTRSKLLALMVNLAKGFDYRCFLTRFVWDVSADGTFTLGFEPIDDADVEKLDETTRHFVDVVRRDPNYAGCTRAQVSPLPPLPLFHTYVWSAPRSPRSHM